MKLTAHKFIGGYNGAKEGYEIPAGTDIFISVRWGISRFKLVLSFRYS